MISDSAPHAHAPAPLDDWFTLRRFGAAVALLIFVAFPGVLLNSSSFVYRDFSLFGYPLAHHLRQSFWNGEVPLWNPFNNCGLPFLAQWNTLTCYPPSLLYLVLPLPWSLNVFCLLHLFVASLTMYCLARCWTRNSLAAAMAGLAFAFSGTVLSTLIWPNYIATFAWMPAVVLCCERASLEGGRKLLLAGLIGSMQMLAGTPELILFTWLMVVVLWADQWWRNPHARAMLLRRSSAVVLLVTGLSAAQLFPFLDLIRCCHRTAQFSTDAYSLPFSGLANYLVPLFRTTPGAAGVHFQPDQFCLSSVYAGIGVLGLAAWALLCLRERRVWLLGGLLLLSLWLALGDKGLLYYGMRRLFSAANFMRYPVKFALLAAFILPLLAAFGFTEWRRRAARNLRLPSGSALVLGALAAGCAGAAAVAYLWPLPEAPWAVTLKSALSRLVFLGLMGFALWRLAAVQAPRKHLALGLGLLALVWLDGMTHTPWQNPVAPPSVYSPGLPTLDAMEPKPALGQSRALLSLAALDRLHYASLTNPAENFLVRRMGLAQNCNLIDQVPTVSGFYALYLPRERDVHYRLYDLEGAARTHLADFLGVSQTTSKENLLEWTARRSFLPLVTAGQKPVFLDAAGTLDFLMSPAFTPQETVCLPPEAHGRLSATNRSDCQVHSCRITSHSVAATVEATQPALVVISQAHYHPWQASVDGRAVPIWLANHAFQAVEVPAGKHEVQLAYRDRVFQAGLLLSAFTLLLGAVLWFRWGAAPPARGLRTAAAIETATGRNAVDRTARLPDTAPACCNHPTASS